MSYDIALLEINGRIHFGDFIKPVCLPYPGKRFVPNTMCVVGGWGRITERGSLSSVLQEVHLDLLDQSKCKQVIQTLRPEQKTFTVMCAGPERGGRDACQGDSGGPLLCPRADGRWVAVGVTSWGKGCGRSWNNNKFKPASRRGSPGVFTDVLMFLSWIKSNLRKGLDRSLCSVPDGVVLGSEGVIRNPARPGQSYNNNEVQKTIPPIMSSSLAVHVVLNLSVGFITWTARCTQFPSQVLDFDDFDLEESEDCEYDSLTVLETLMISERRLYEDQWEEADDDSRVISPHLQAGLSFVLFTLRVELPDVTEASGLDGLKSGRG
ncbi:ovochymase-2-like [Danio aesculapii]|uniref:ovochymase-2-like n=1 Tax=Danio aesculapii TaxID=1142201 RepID=UPI0024BFE4B4|nr:ovochymase-2-like [Danio aesculapii]